MKEIRVFIADSTDYYKNLDIDSDIEDIMDCAESMGTVYSLEGLALAYNSSELPQNENTIMRVCLFNNGEFVKEIK